MSRDEIAGRTVADNTLFFRTSATAMPELAHLAAATLQAAQRRAQCRTDVLALRAQFATMLREVEGDDVASQLSWRGGLLSRPRIYRSNKPASPRPPESVDELDPTPITVACPAAVEADPPRTVDACIAACVAATLRPPSVPTQLPAGEPPSHTLAAASSSVCATNHADACGGPTASARANSTDEADDQATDELLAELKRLKSELYARRRQLRAAGSAPA